MLYGDCEDAQRPTEQSEGQECLVSRERVLLKAAYDILKKCNEGFYVQNALEVTAEYDGTDCDGYCLANDIAILLDLDELDQTANRCFNVSGLAALLGANAPGTTMELPILMQHDPSEAIGVIRCKDNGVFFEFTKDTKITRDMLFEIFGGAGIKVTDMETEGDEIVTIKAGQILEFSWPGYKPALAETENT